MAKFSSIFAWELETFEFQWDMGFSLKLIFGNAKWWHDSAKFGENLKYKYCSLSLYHSVYKYLLKIWKRWKISIYWVLLSAKMFLAGFLFFPALFLIENKHDKVKSQQKLFRRHDTHIPITFTVWFNFTQFI